MENSEPTSNETPISQGPPSQGGGIPQPERQWAMFSHLSALLIFVGIPFGNLIAPLIMWQMKKGTMAFGAAQARESLNFQISVTLYAIGAAILCFVIIGFLILPALLIVDVVFVIIAAIKANDGVDYRYPLTIRFFK